MFSAGEGFVAMMLNLDPQYIQDSLRRLSRAGLDVFGASSHSYILDPRLPEQEVLAFEERHHIHLPEDYRHFIMNIGNGGAGPDYGFFPLGYMDDTPLKAWTEGNGFVGVLSQDFQFDEPWNDTSGLPDFNPNEDQQDEYDRAMEAFEQRYWSSSLMNGAFPICHRGCALRLWLVIAGKEAGHIWRDGRADYTGLSPLLLKDGSRATLSWWYWEWLDECLSRLHER